MIEPKHVVIVLAGALSLAACAPPPEPPRAPIDRPLAPRAQREPAKGARRIVRREDWVSVAIASPPPARVRCSFDTASGDHEDVEWDPAQPSGLAKVIRLRGRSADRSWSMACAADPLPIKTSAGDRLLVLDVLKAPPRALPTGPSKAPIAELKARFVDPAEPPSPPQRRAGPAPVSFDDRSLDESRAAPASLRIHVTVTPIAAPAIGSAPREGAPITANRSFDAAPAAAAELFKVLAEIALERARAQAGALVARELESAICRRLVWSEPLRDALALSSLPSERRLLPRTCDAIRLLRVEEIMASAESLRRELTSDLSAFVTVVLADHLTAPRPLPAPEARVALAPSPPRAATPDAPPAPPPRDAAPLAPLAPVLSALSRVALDLAMDRARPRDHDAASIITELSRVTWPEGDCGGAGPRGACAFGCGVELFGALTDELARAGDAARIELRDAVDEILAGRGDLDLRACGAAAREIAASWPDMSHLVARASHARDLREGTSARAAARDAVSLALDLIERGACSVADPRTCAVARAARGVLLAAADGETHRMIVGAASIVERAIGEADPRSSGDGAWSEERAALLTLTKIAGAVTAYATAGARDGKGDAEALAAQRDARKRAMESLLDGAGDRRGKGGKLVASLGASLGFMAGGEHVREATAPRGLVPSVSLPLGLAIQKLPRPDAPSSSWLGRHAGFHLQLSAIDLGQLLAVDEGRIAKPRPDSFFTAALEIGLLLGTPSYAVVLGADARYAPSLYGKGAARFGAFVGFYIPFFDLD